MNHLGFRTQYTVIIAPTLYMVLVALLLSVKDSSEKETLKKYTSVRDSLPRNQRLVFVLMNPDKKVRKGGKLTMAAWCEKEKIKWYNVDTLQELIKDVTNTGGN